MSSSSQITESWINAFCSLVGHEYFAEVSEDFIEDDFNLTGLQSQVPMYKEALEMILDVEPEDASEEDEDEDEDVTDASDASMRDSQSAAYRRTERRHLRLASDLSVIESSAELLYGLIHQRFITSRPGIQQMLEKYEMGHFGACPRVHCRGAKVLPVGCSDIPGQETVKLFCPACLDVYAPPNSRFQSVDGAFFGTTFGCLFFMTFPELDVGGSKLPVENGISSSPLAVGSSSSLTPQNSLDANGSKSRTSISPSNPAASAPSPQPVTINGVSASNLAPGLGQGSIYEPRIYGFRVSELAKSGPRMKWLRTRPTDVNELDEVAIWDKNQELILAANAVDGELADGEEGAEAAEEDLDALDEEEEVDEVDEDEEEDEEEDGHNQGVEVQETLPAAQTTENGRRKKGRRRDGTVNGERVGGGAAVGAVS